MVTSSKNSWFITMHMSLHYLFVGVFLLFTPPVFAQSDPPPSPDGKYEAVRVGSADDMHFQVKEVKTGHVVLTTHAEYPNPNNVKAGLFSSDSKEFAAAYHYSHEGIGHKLSFLSSCQAPV
ncbi:MAG: hypothetical protein U1F76_20415 [Candidatus Competibacteraceae bacterium]